MQCIAMLDLVETTKWEEAWDEVPVGQTVLVYGTFFQCYKDPYTNLIFHIDEESVKTLKLLAVKVRIEQQDGDEYIECLQVMKREQNDLVLVDVYLLPDLTSTIGFTPIDIGKELDIGKVSSGTIGIYNGYYYKINSRRKGGVYIYKEVNQSIDYGYLLVMKTIIKNRFGNDIPCFVILKKSSEYPDLYAITDRYILPGVGQCEFKETNLSIGGKVEVAQVADLQAGNIGIASCMVYPVQTVSEGGKVVIVEIRDTVPFILFDKIGRVVELKDTDNRAIRVIEILKRKAVDSFISTGRYYVPINGRFRVLPSGLLIVR